MIRGNKFQRDIIATQNDLAPILEINRDTGADDRLDLAQPPIGTDAMAHDGADFKEGLRHDSSLVDMQQ